MRLTIQGLSKYYPGSGVRALQDVSLDLGPGMFGLLGPNGAGKSTLMRTLATLQDPDAGSVTFGDIDVLRQKDEMRRRLGYLPQEFGFYPNLSAEATLEHFAVLKGLSEPRARRETVYALLAQTNLYEARKNHVGGFSGGMRQRLGIAIALLGDPKLIIVDEPTAGLDPTERNRFLNLLSEVGENVIVILSTHIVEDVRELCRDMAILLGGRIVARGEPESVIEPVRGRIWRKRLESKAELPEAHQRYFVVSSRLVAGRPVLSVYSEDGGPPGEGFTPVEADLEDAYFFHTAMAARAGMPPPAPSLPPPS